LIDLGQLEQLKRRVGRIRETLDRPLICGEGWSGSWREGYIFNPPDTGVADTIGACCHWYGCENSTEAECLADENFPVWMGAGTRCDSVTCPSYACCYCDTDPDCFNAADPEMCTFYGFTSAGLGTICDDCATSELIPLCGACCFEGDPTCTEPWTEDDCVNSEGAWHEHSACDPNPCCPRDIPTLNSVTILSRITISDTRADCALDFDSEVTHTWTRIDRFDGAGNFVTDPGDNEFQLWLGCDGGIVGKIASGSNIGGALEAFDVPHPISAAICGRSSCDPGFTDTPLGENGTSDPAGHGAGAIYFTGGVSDGVLIDPGSSSSVACCCYDGVTPLSCCGEADSYGEEFSAASIAAALGSYAAEATHSGTGYSYYYKTTVTLA
jgi:hypothetical protein